MKYALAREHIQSGDLLAWSHRGWSSWYDFQIQVVRMATRSEYSHVGMAWKMGGRLFALEAVQPIVRIFPLSKITPFYWIPGFAPEWRTEIEEYALSKVGEDYSRWKAIQSFVMSVPIGTDTKWQCAEYVMSIFKENGIDINVPRPTPSAVVEYALQQNAYAVLVES